MVTCFSCKHHAKRFNEEPCASCGEPREPRDWSPKLNNYPHWESANGFPLFLPKDKDGPIEPKPEPKPVEKPATPAPSTWTFVSTDKAFDGPRIVREAQEAGLEAYEVTREGQRVLLLSRGYVQRLQAAGVEVGVHPEGVVVHPATPVITQDGKLRLTNSYSTGAALGFVGSESLDSLSARLKAAEKARTKIRTTVKGV